MTDIIRNGVAYRYTFVEEPIEENFTEKFIRELCDELELELITDCKSLATELNEYYVGYKLHKKTHVSHKNPSCVSLKEVNRKYETVFKAASKLSRVLVDLEEYKNGSISQMLDGDLSIVQERQPCGNWTIKNLAEELNVLKMVTEFARLFTGGTIYESSSKEWFVGKAIPLLFDVRRQMI